MSDEMYDDVANFCLLGAQLLVEIDGKEDLQGADAVAFKSRLNGFRLESSSYMVRLGRSLSNNSCLSKAEKLSLMASITDICVLSSDIQNFYDSAESTAFYFNDYYIDGAYMFEVIESLLIEITEIN